MIWHAFDPGTQRLLCQDPTIRIILPPSKAHLQFLANFGFVWQDSQLFLAKESQSYKMLYINPVNDDL